MIANIYLVENLINHKRYVGFTTNFEARVSAHKKLSGRKYYLHRAMKKYGGENFKFEVIYQSKDVDHCLKVMEPYFIEKFNTYNDGYNLTLGGEGAVGLDVPEHTRIAVGNANRKRNWTEKSKKQLRQRMLGNLQRLGSRWSGEQREKFIASKKGYRHSQKTIDKMKQAASTQEYKEKLSKIVSDRWKDSEKRKIQAQKHSKYTYEVTCPDNTKIQVNNLKQFARDNNLGTSAIYAVVNGRWTHHKGFVAKRIEKPN